jgi:purine-binding chemotaxis protein CheW
VVRFFFVATARSREEAASADRGGRRVLLVEAAERTLGIPVEYVAEIVRAVAISPLPGAPALVEGVIDLRGVVVPVVEMRRVLGVPSTPVSPSDHLVIVADGSRRTALRVDRAVDLTQSAELEEVAEIGTAAARVARTGEGVVVVPDVDGLLRVSDVSRFVAAEEA